MMRGAGAWQVVTVSSATAGSGSGLAWHGNVTCSHSVMNPCFSGGEAPCRGWWSVNDCVSECVTEGKGVDMTVAKVNEPARVYCVNDCVFVLSSEGVLLGNDECQCDRISSGISNSIVSELEYEKLFRSCFQESLNFFRRCKRVVRIVSAGECLVCFGCDNEVWTHGMNLLGNMSTTCTSSGTEVIDVSSENGCDYDYNWNWGVGTEEITPRLNLLSSRVNPTHIAVGLFHILVVDDKGGVWAAGQGMSGELGGGHRVEFSATLVDIKLPQLQEEDSEDDEGMTCEGSGSEKAVVEMRAVRAYAGAKTSVVVAQRVLRRKKYWHDGQDTRSARNSVAHIVEEVDECVFTFGSGAYFKLGHGDRDDDELSPRILESLWRGGLTGVAEVACGRFHMALLGKETHDVYLWGWAKFGQFGNASGEEEIFREPFLLSHLDAILDEKVNERVLRLVCGSRHTAFLTSTGRVLTMGALNSTIITDPCSSEKGVAVSAHVVPRATGALTDHFFVPITRLGLIQAPPTLDDNDGGVDEKGIPQSLSVGLGIRKRKRTIETEMRTLGGTDNLAGISTKCVIDEKENEDFSSKVPRSINSIIDIAGSAFNVSILTLSKQ